jgi:hypothetical protein
VEPGQYAEMRGVAYTTVMYWLQGGKVEGSVKHETPHGHYWELPDDTPRPKKEGAKKSTKKGAAK